MDEWVAIWLAAAVAFAVAEMMSPGSFFMLPFAVGAAAAALLSLLAVGTLGEWIGFLAVSAIMLASLRPLARRLDQSTNDKGIGARRLVGQTALVTQNIPPGDLGMVRVHREDWRAESIDGSSIPEGASVLVSEVEGTRVRVALLDVEGPAGAEASDDVPPPL